MLKFLLFIFFFVILLVFLMGFSILRTFKNILFGRDSGGKRNGQRRQPDSYSSDTRSSNNSTEYDEYVSPSHHKKIFAKDEGEYVDFEEVK